MDPSRRAFRMTTPIGELELVASGAALVEIRMQPDAGDGRRAQSGHRARERDRAASDRRSPADDTRAADLAVLTTARRQLAEYFAGRSHAFALPTRPTGTEFQRAVWDGLREVGYGETVTYGELAARIGRPHAARAVGQALAANPIPIIVPCHRVVGRLGELTGFGGGIERKRLLLELEAR